MIEKVLRSASADLQESEKFSTRIVWTATNCPQDFYTNFDRDADLSPAKPASDPDM
jgi:hypothetical protein